MVLLQLEMADNNCYRFEEITGKNPLFAHIDATYVIHLEGNGRLEGVRKELSEFYPSKNTCILFNKGYKKCEKPQLPMKETRYDLIDANLFIFRDAQEKKYKNILVLEDDFFFHKETRNHIIHIDEFLGNNQYSEFLYFLGCIPLVSIPALGHHNQVMFSVAAHAVVYSELYRDGILRVKQSDIHDWDVFQFTHRPFNKYMYHRPICYQLFPETENSKTWGNQNPAMRFLAKILIKILQIMKLDVQAEPSYSILYFVSKLLIPLFVLIVCFFLVYPYFIRSRKFIRRNK